MLKMKKKIQKGDSVEAYFTRVNVCDCSSSCVTLCNCGCNCHGTSASTSLANTPYSSSYRNESSGFEGNTNYVTA